MLQQTRLLIACFLFSLAAVAQNTTPVTISAQPVTTQASYAYKNINPQLSYAFIIDKPGKIHPQEGDNISINMQSVYNNRPLYSTFVAMKGKPAVYSVTKPAYKGDLIEAIMLMTPGDSIVCLADAETLYKNSKTKKPDFIKTGDKIQYFIKLVSIKPKEQVLKEQQEAFMKQMKEQEAKQKAAAAKQMIVDDKKLKTYFTSHQLSPVKTASGMYYIIKEEGTGELAMPGDTVTMMYTGRLLDGTKFDSNEDSAFFHMVPYQFPLGRGQVIKGWDEGITHLKPGSKATFYIPSPLGYGPQASPGVNANPKGIPANSILVFDVQLISCKHTIAVAPSAPKADSLAVPVKN
jgi:FKBP-type peptidyl-prolyl cis-trans isomerase